MTDIMFEIPSNSKIEKCIIKKETVQNLQGPEVIINENKENEDNQKNKIKNKATA